MATVIDRTLSVAPMMGRTDRHCRYLLRLLSAHAMLYSEMVVSGALIHGDAEHFLQHQGDEPCGMQIGGSNPKELAECARMIEDHGYQEVNLNVGCPSDRVQLSGIGACLMAEPSLVAECVNEMKNAVAIPVTVKSRTGLDDVDCYDFLDNFVATVAEGGCQVFIIHARNAILSGLSPKDNRDVPPLKHDYVFALKTEYPDLAIVLNGGLKVTEEIPDILTKVDGIMLGRDVYHHPLSLLTLERLLFPPQDFTDVIEILEAYIDYMDKQVHHGVYLRHMARHLLGFFHGFPGARSFRRHLSETMYDDDAGVDVVRAAVDLVDLHNG